MTVIVHVVHESESDEIGVLSWRGSRLQASTGWYTTGKDVSSVEPCLPLFNQTFQGVAQQSDRHVSIYLQALPKGQACLMQLVSSLP